MNYWLAALTALLGLAGSFVLIPLILTSCRRGRLSRSGQALHHTHKVPVPRFGGVAIAAAFVLAALTVNLTAPPASSRAYEWNLIVIGSLAMFGLGLWDDVRPLGAKLKLAGQVLISAAVFFLGLGIQKFEIPFTGVIVELGGLGMPVTVLWLVGITNLINLIDGVDGLAGGICLMLMLLLAYVGHEASNIYLLASGLAGGLLGFLWFNFPPARIHLGDGGAYFLGFFIGAATIANSQKGTILAALAAPLFALALPILDTALAILRRGLRGLPLFRPDRRHIHHRLLAMGISRKRLVLGMYGFTMFFLFLGFAAFLLRGQWLPILAGVGTLAVLLTAGQFRFSREWFAVGRVLGNSREIRREIQYALSLTRWLTLEGGQCKSIESLWLDFLQIAQKLGFTSAKLTLPDGCRVWRQGNGGSSDHVEKFELEGGRLGILELSARPCPREGDHSPPACGDGWPCEWHCPCVADQRIFPLVSELLAEGWLAGARNWEKERGVAVRFDSRIAPVETGGTRNGGGSLTAS